MDVGKMAVTKDKIIQDNILCVYLILSSCSIDKEFFYLNVVWIALKQPLNQMYVLIATHF